MSAYPTADARLSRQGLGRWRSGHPWIFRAGIAEVTEDTGNEAVARVRDPQGRVLGFALLSRESQITLRILTRSPDPIDAGFWRGRLERAIAHRQQALPHRNAVRLVFGESDGLPGLIVDRYGNHLVLQSLAWAMSGFQSEMVGLLQSLATPESILARNDAGVRSLEGLPREVVQLLGETPDDILYQEGELSLAAHPRTGQKTGAFLDQYENHLRAGSLARGRVLDMFCYTGGFSLAAARKAESVVAVDSSAGALDQARSNAERNDISNIRFVEANAFDFLKSEDRENRRYDMVILDPPAFAKSKRELESALRGYKEINLRAMKILRPGGILITCSCSYHLTGVLMDEVLARAAADANRVFRLRERRLQPPDHPVRIGFPESLYLKCQVLEFVD